MEKKYTVLLVDDEEEVIQVIMNKIDWEGLGFHIVGYAHNGVKALELAEEYEPDIVMTDIKMPYMDGLTLSRQLKKEFPSIRILLFTGFDEFEYAREAIHLEVEEYISKPISAPELTKIFEKLKHELDEEYSEKRNVERLLKYYEESLPVLQANFYIALIEGTAGKNNVETDMRDYQITLDGPFFCCVILHTSSHRVPDGMNPMLLSLSVQHEAEDYVGKHWGCHFFTYLGDTVVIMQMNTEEKVKVVTDLWNSFARDIQKSIGAVVTAGVGIPVDDLTKLSKSYQGAREAVSYRVLYGTSRAINIREIAPKENTTAEQNGEDYLQELQKRILLGTEDELHTAVDQYVDHVLIPSGTIHQYRTTVMELAGFLYHFSQKNAIDLNTVLGKQIDLYRELPEMTSDVIRPWLQDTAFALQKAVAENRSQTTQSFVGKAIDYIEAEYKDPDLSVDTMCSVLNVSSSYFSAVFKRETGKAFVQYLTEYRMKEAIRLLTETEDKNYLIAEKVGYTDANYFSYVFKKQYGVSPSKYRSELKNREAT